MTTANANAALRAHCARDYYERLPAAGITPPVEFETFYHAALKLRRALRRSLARRGRA